MTASILVTGGLGDIGAAIARKFAVNGWSVAVNDLLPVADAIARLHAMLPKEKRQPEQSVGYFMADNTNQEAVERMFTGIAGAMGVPSVVAVNAGIVEPASVLEMTPEIWHRHIQVNLTGAFYVAQAAARRMREAGGGVILFTGSWVGAVPSRNIGAYCVSKAGLEMLARQMALELAASGIRVNVVAPGIVDAGLSGQLFRSGQADPRPFEKAIPLHRLQTADQVADAFWLLAQPEAEYITGATLLCDGGMSLFNWQESTDLTP